LAESDHERLRFWPAGGPSAHLLAALLADLQAAVTFRAQQMVASVQLIKAPGGGWDA